MTAEIISVGTELLLGNIVDTNAPFIARRLAELGIDVYGQSVVGDNRQRLLNALALAFSRADLVITSGGLGPTGDDLTKETVAAYFDRPLELNAQILDEIKDFFLGIHHPFTPNNTKQAMVPQNAHIFMNQHGTAPGLAVRKGAQTAVLLPGPPHEMEPMLDQQVIPYLQNMIQRTILSHSLHLFGIGESALEDQLSEQISTSSNPTLAPYAKRGEVELRVTASGTTKSECEKLMQPVIKSLEEELSPYLYGIDVPNIQSVVVRNLREKHITIATAESCTGGLLSEQITQIPGASAVFALGVCTYANTMKERILNVKPDTLARYGAVSRETAGEMARNVRLLANADIGVATTGIAGPDGGTADKPVGTVYIGIDSPAGTAIRHLRLYSIPDRELVRHLTALNVFFMILQLIREWRTENEH